MNRKIEILMSKHPAQNEKLATEKITKLLGLNINFKSDKTIVKFTFLFLKFLQYDLFFPADS